MSFTNLFNFEKFLSPYLVTIIYWLGVVIAAYLAMRIGVQKDSSVYEIILAGGVFVSGLIIWRVFCEALVLAFKIFDRLTEIRDRLPNE